MAKKKRNDDEVGEGTWLNTYADMVTLLLTFFVMLFSMSSVQEDKWEVLIKAFTKRGDETSQIVVTPVGNGSDMAANHGEAPLPADGDNIDTTTQLPSDISELFDYIKSYMEESELEGAVEVSESDGTVYIRFDDNVFFQPDRYELLPEGREVLGVIGDGLKSVEDQILIITVDGHTASVDNFEKYPVSDWRLSGERAASAVVFLEEDKLIASDKLMLLGYGKSRPIADNADAQGRQKNRRVDMMIVSNTTTPDSQQLLKQIFEGNFDASVYPRSGGISDVLLPETVNDPPDEQSPAASPAESPAAEPAEPPAEGSPAPDVPAGSPPAQAAPDPAEPVPPGKLAGPAGEQADT